MPIKKRWLKDLKKEQYCLPYAYVIVGGNLRNAAGLKAPSSLLGCILCPFAVDENKDNEFHNHLDLPARHDQKEICDVARGRVPEHILIHWELPRLI
ncbi:hypothetical protein AURDEDRAFT_165874 [Auricularia subglabra TFB-10046 SS5]|nr:hypothetical protein AURDEDRAFT_165874 [Auricularia subglabra TFB-10046 SS5]